MQRGPQFATCSVLLSPATTELTALNRGLKARDWFKTSVAFATLLSKVTPILLSNIPFRVMQTWRTHLVCAWMTVAILGYMILVLLATLVVRRPRIPVEPDTIAGGLYYVCDSPMLSDFVGLSTLDRAERDRLIERMGRKYTLGPVMGDSGLKRIGVDYDG